MHIKGNTFLVAGGASGLGAATVRALAAAGANVAILDRHEPAGAGLAREIGSPAIFASADVTSEEQVGGAIAATRKAFGELRGAVNCAGVATGERVLGRDGPHKLDTFRRVVEINLVGSFNVMRLAAQAIAECPPV